MEERYPEEAEAWEEDPYTFSPVGGESGLAVTARALPALMEIIHQHAGEAIVVVSHKATIRLLLTSMLGFDPRRFRDNLDQNPAALNIVDFKSPVRARLMLFNDTSHYANLSKPETPQSACQAGGRNNASWLFRQKSPCPKRLFSPAIAMGGILEECLAVLAQHEIPYRIETTVPVFEVTSMEVLAQVMKRFCWWNQPSSARPAKPCWRMRGPPSNWHHQRRMITWQRLTRQPETNAEGTRRLEFSRSGCG